MQTAFQEHGLPLPTSSIFPGEWWAKVRSRQFAPTAPLSQCIFFLGRGVQSDEGPFSGGIWRGPGTAPWLPQVTSIRIQSVSSSRPLCLDLLKSWGLRGCLHCPLFTSSNPTWDSGGRTGDPNPDSQPHFPLSIPACLNVADPSEGSREGKPEFANPGAPFTFFLEPPLYPQPKRQCPFLSLPSLELCITRILYLCITDVICTKGSS